MPFVRWDTATSGSTSAWQIWTSDGTNTVTAGTTAAAYNARIVWRAWTVNSDGIIASPSPQENWIIEAEYRRETRREIARARLARIRAERLLTDHLSESQRRDLKRFGFFKLYVGNKVYRIRRGQVQNIDLVQELPDGRLQPLQTLCAHPDMVVPDADAMLIQKLWLETDEKRFLEIANQMAPVGAARLALNPARERRAA